MSEKTSQLRKLKNIGPVLEFELNELGVFNIEDLKNRGVELTFKSLMEARIELGSGGKCFNASYLYALYGAVHSIDWREIPKKKKEEFKNWTAQLRKEYSEK